MSSLASSGDSNSGDGGDGTQPAAATTLKHASDGAREASGEVVVEQSCSTNRRRPGPDCRLVTYRSPALTILSIVTLASSGDGGGGSGGAQPAAAPTLKHAADGARKASGEVVMEQSCGTKQASPQS